MRETIKRNKQQQACLLGKAAWGKGLRYIYIKKRYPLFIYIFSLSPFLGTPVLVAFVAFVAVNQMVL